MLALLCAGKPCHNQLDTVLTNSSWTTAVCCTVFDPIVPPFVLPMSVAAVDGLVTPEPDSGQCESGTYNCCLHYMLGTFAEKFDIQKMELAMHVQFMMATSIHMQYRKRKNVNNLSLWLKGKIE